jgi:uncharacterized protein YndB with AHSA1/START domain
MSEDRIERETVIAAPVERVWSLVAQPGFWVADKTSLPGTVAREGATYLAYRWASAFHGQELRADNSTLVEFTLTPEGEKTRLRVVESGFSALAGSEDLRSQAFEDNKGGWPLELDALKARAEQSSV